MIGRGEFLVGPHFSGPWDAVVGIGSGAGPGDSGETESDPREVVADEFEDFLVSRLENRISDFKRDKLWEVRYQGASASSEVLEEGKAGEEITRLLARSAEIGQSTVERLRRSLTSDEFVQVFDAEESKVQSSLEAFFARQLDVFSQAASAFGKGEGGGDGASG